MAKRRKLPKRLFKLRDTPGGALRASGTRLAPTKAERRPAGLARAGIRRKIKPSGIYCETNWIF